LESVVADVGVTVPSSRVVSMYTVCPAIGLPWPSIKEAVTVAVPPGAITGVVVARDNVAMGAGGPTVTSSSLDVVPVDDPIVAVTVRNRSPWMSGTVHGTVAEPVTSVVAVPLLRTTPDGSVAVAVTVAPWTGIPPCET
jgi:hypothetical protein